MHKFYTSIQQVFINYNIAKIARDFSKNVTATTNYCDSNQFSRDKISNDHFVSKIGEEAAKMVLSKYGKVKGPDYTIYKAAEKSWADDLYFEGVGIAVKTQKRSAAEMFGLSWTFQAGTSRRDLILNKPNAWIIFVEYNDHNPYECFVYPPFKLKELTLEEPKLAKLQGYKKVVYAKCLPKII